jgi:hypothetical protein
MQLNIVDGAGNPQILCVQAPDTPADASGTIAATGVSQLLMAPNAGRSGWLFQNNGAHAMTLNEIGGNAVSASSWTVAPGGIFPPHGFPAVPGQMNVAGTMGDTYTARQW